LHVAQLMKQRGRGLGAVDQHALRHLELQPPRIDAAFRQRIGHALDDVRLQQLPRGEIDVNVERAVHSGP